MHDIEASSAPASALQRAYGSWAALMERLPIGVYVCDADGLIARFNLRVTELWGVSPHVNDPTVRFCGAFKLFEPDGTPMSVDRSPMAEVLATGASVRDREFMVERPDGVRLHLLANAEPLLDEQGRLAGGVGCVQDVTELREAAARLRERQSWTRRVLEFSPIATYSTDPEGRLTAFNQAAVALWGREPTIGVDRWCGSYRLYHTDGRPMPLDQCPMSQTLREGREVRGEAVIERPDGSRGAFLAYPTPLMDSNGVIVGAINMLVDISERKSAEDLQKALLAELNHRVKNTLATVQSLASHSFRAGGDPADMRAAFESRLIALSKTHNQLAARNWEDAELHTVIADILAPFTDDTDRLELSGPMVRLSAREAVSFAMVLHELATNALRYGSLSATTGRLRIGWSRTLEALALEWREFGGPLVQAPTRRGFGSRFIAGAVSRDLGGDVRFDFAETGLNCRIRARLAA